MPAFVNNGPDIPERLLDKHEEGRVVFFCGAGISYPADLPGFHGLVEKTYKKLYVFPESAQQAAIDKRQFDAAIGLLEDKIPGGREKVRGVIAGILNQYNPSDKKTTATHEALLTLGRTRDRQMRLITTNFDRLFEEVIKKNNLTITRFNAPLLPIPKNRWDGLVYLHGLLPSPNSTEGKLDQLVISSGDFGRAYLTERWAARFVSEIFRNYTVCFIGYSINDPVIRYMMDALAADRLLGESPLEMFAFVAYSKSKKEKIREEWNAKNVTPVLYRKCSQHIYLHETLQEWSEIYRDGVRGKEMIIAQHAGLTPLHSSKFDFAVGRVLWALTDDLAAKHFADMDPVPPLEWLKPLSEDQYRHGDLPRFGVNPGNTEHENLKFSVLCRPTRHDLAPKMSIAGIWGDRGGWDAVMRHLGRWLTRHLNDPELILWIVKQGGRLHWQFAELVQEMITKIAQLEEEGKQDDIKQILANPQNAMPYKTMCALWHLILSGRLESSQNYTDINQWISRLEKEGLTLTMRFALREILTPSVRVTRPISLYPNEYPTEQKESIERYVDCKLVLRSDHVLYDLQDIKNNPAWVKALPELLSDFTMLLRDALDIKCELGRAGEKSDFSRFDQPSISEHPQNMKSQDWTALIELTRDAWLATAQEDPKRARHIAEGWWQIPYPLFKRLVFFAATHDHVISHGKALSWLLADNHRWLWSSETQREKIRLITVLAPALSQPGLKKLEKSILKGLPRKKLKDGIEQERWDEMSDHAIWFLLAKIKKAGASLGQDAVDRLTELERVNPSWKLAEDERDEFPFYIESISGVRNFVATPKRRRELADWIKRHPDYNIEKQDDWITRCEKNFPTTACALFQLAQEGIWPVSRWNEALQVWSEENFLKRSWRYITKVVSTAPDEKLKAISNNLGSWLLAQSNNFNGQDERFFLLARRLLEPAYENEAQESNSNNPVFHAINHPVGHATRALLYWWHQQKPKNGEGLRREIKPLLTEICNIDVKKFRHGRVVLAVHALFLFLVDEEWTKAHLLPLFDWHSSSEEARYVWAGFLQSPRIYWPLLSIIKNSFLETASHYLEIDNHDRQYADFLVYVSLEHNETITTQELSDATNALPDEGLEHSVYTLIRGLDGAKEQKNEYLTHRILPYIQKIWPKFCDRITPQISQGFRKLCVMSGEKFPEVFEELKPWLSSAQQPSTLLLHKLSETDLCGTFPDKTLEFLDTVINDAIMSRENLNGCLDAIKSSDPTLSDDPRFVRLLEICQRSQFS